MVQVQVGTWILANVFSALLPPKESSSSEESSESPEQQQQQQQESNNDDIKDEDNVCFYKILGVSENATNEEIRKAYKKASLKYHPDKVAQRGNMDATQAQQKYEKIQEAYGILVNDEKRQRYRILGNSPKRYRFVQQGNLHNPGALYENLTSANCIDKTRLVVLCNIIVLLVLLQPILIAAKVNHVVDPDGGALQNTSWVALLVPFWIMAGAFIGFWIVLLWLVPNETKLTVGLTVIEYILWYWAVMRMARKWDGTIDARYASVLVPVYLAMSVRWIQSMVLLHKIRSDVRKMVSLDYLEKEVFGEDKTLENLSEEEQEQLKRDYMVVSVPDDFEPIPDVVADEDGNPITQPLDEKQIEEQKVEASPEFEAATEIYNSTFGGLVGSLIFGSLFLITLTLKLDGKIDASWWTVFVPIWIYWGCKWLFYFYTCGCGSLGIGGEEVILHIHESSPTQDQDQEQNNNNGGGDEEEGRNMTTTTTTQDDNNNGNKQTNNTNNGESKNDDDDDDKRKGDRQGSSTSFQNPNQSIQDFKKPSKINTGNNNDDGLEEGGRDDEEEDDLPDDEKEADDLRKKTSKEEDQDEKNPNPTTNDDDDDGDDADNIRVDEETFRAWQSAYEEAERGAMEEQAKASMECCTLTIKLALLIMVVAKIQKSYEPDDPDDVGFNTFWILFPFFVFFGCLGCCCTCAIYCAAPGDADDLYDDNGSGDDEQQQHEEVGDEEQANNGNDNDEKEKPVATASDKNTGDNDGGNTSSNAASEQQSIEVDNEIGVRNKKTADENSPLVPTDTAIETTYTNSGGSAGLEAVSPIYGGGSEIHGNIEDLD